MTEYFGRLYLFCQVCGIQMECTVNSPWHHRVCSPQCWDEYQLRDIRSTIRAESITRPEGWPKHLVQPWRYRDDSIKRKFCIHPRHNDPCPLPCSGCEEECKETE